MTWLLIDCPNLLHRAYHACGPLTYNEMPTGALYGFFRDVLKLRRLYDTDDFVFAFDAGVSLRKQVYPRYKANRLKNPPQVCNYFERAGRKELAKQMDRLRFDLLPGCLGYPNVVFSDGYEADDVIAVACEYLKGTSARKVIVSNDKDLYQLMSYEDVSIWKPGKEGGEYTLEDFRREFRFYPHQMPLYKALCGDVSDNIRGLPGVGVKSATQFLCKEKVVLKKAARHLHEPTPEMERIKKTNLLLTTLPYPGCPTFKIKRQYTRCPDKAWREVLGRLGMKTLEV